MLGATARQLKYTLGADALDWLVRRTPLLDGGDAPPAWINFAGAADFQTVGDHTVGLVRELAGVSEGERVLDIGSAIGRNALALHRAYGGGIHYQGFDIVRYGISWSTKRFAALPGRYQFHHADICNGFYNPRGRVRAADYTFPAADGSVDVSIATSVYTHMRQDALARYLAETARVAAPGGRAFFTLFGRDGASETSVYRFAHRDGTDWVDNPAEPEAAIAHDLEAVEATLRELGASEVELYPGYWRRLPRADRSRGHSRPAGYGRDLQDIVVARWPQ